MITLQFSTTDGFASKVICFATWSPFSHVDLVLPDGRLIGATARHGVSIRDPEPVLRSMRFEVDAPGSVIDRLLTQTGKAYDWPGVFGWGLRRNWQEDDSWFCSELVAWAFHAEGFPLLREPDMWRITPRDLLLSPYLNRTDGFKNMGNGSLMA